ncbi:MAG: hypothetical protein ACLVEV_11465, partial [Lachnospiraceae bacterium]
IPPRNVFSLILYLLWIVSGTLLSPALLRICFLSAFLSVFARKLWTCQKVLCRCGNRRCSKY